MFDAPKSTRGIGSAPANSAERRIRSVVRIYTWIGWLIVVVYVPVVVFCAIAFLMRLYGKQFGPPGTPLMILAGTLFNVAVFAPGFFYVRTARRIKLGDSTAHRAAQVLACVMMLGFPLFTVVGIYCLRVLRTDFVTTAGDDEDKV